MTGKPRMAEGKLGYIADDIAKLGELLAHDPAAVRELDDRELLALDVWTDGGNEIIRAECVRRAEQGRRFAAYLAPHKTGDTCRP